MPSPGDAQSFDRYAYANNNALRYVDPTGHCAENGDEACWSQYEALMRLCPNCTHVLQASQGYIPAQAASYARLRAETRLAAQATSLGPIETTSLTSILAETLGAMSADLPISVSFDESGTPSVNFDEQALRKAVLFPLSACAQKIQGVCGVSTGGSTNLQIGAGVRGSVDIYADPDANFVILGTYGGGAYTPFSSPSTRYTISGIPNAKLVDTDGVFAQLGVSGALTVGAAGEGIFGKADDGHSVRGQAYGISIGVGADLYFTITNSHAIYSSQYGWFQLGE